MEKINYSIFIEGFGQTVYMVSISSILACLLGLVIGVLLITSEENGIKPNLFINKIMDFIVNILRSMPFLILMVAVIPLTRLIVGSAIGPTATIVPLVIGASPFVGRLVENALREVDAGIIEAALSMGASPMQIVLKVMIPEALPSLVLSATVSVTTILGYSAMAGIIGGKGLGDIAIRYGYNRFEPTYMWIAVIILVVLVQLIQFTGNRLASKLDKRKK